MPNIKSAIKRVEVNARKNALNRTEKSKIATYIKKFKLEVAKKDFDNAQKLLSEVFALVDSAAKENVIHKNSANAKKASLAKLLDNAKK